MNAPMLLRAGVLALLCAPAVALGHAELTPSTVPAGHSATLTLQVPNERPDEATTEIAVQIPDGVTLVRFQPKPGWTRIVETEPLPSASTVGDATVTERVSVVRWRGGRIAPGEFETFQLAVGVPETPGETLTFPTLQTYAGGDVVRWIGPADGDEPAPVVTIGEEAEDHHDDEAAAGDDDHGSDTVAYVALGLGAVGLAAGLAGLVVALRRRREG